MIGHIGKLQHYSTKDGPGIRTTVFLLGCSLRCRWCANPEFLNPTPTLMYFKDRCQRCGLCAKTYPDAITLSAEGCQIDRKKADANALVDLCPYDSYEVQGFDLSAEELVQRLLKDKEFYETSHGGVTFSGGECLLQAEIVKECMELLHKEGIHVTLDTAGNVPWEVMESAIQEADLILYDIKAFDSELHRQGTGVGNELILSNFKKITEAGKDVIVRMILIPGYNDSKEDIMQRIDLVSDCKVKQIDFLKYHILGIGKYEKLGMEYELKNIGSLDDSILEFAQLYAQKKGIRTTVGG